MYGDFLVQKVAVFRPHFEKAYTGPNGEKPDSTARAMDSARAQEETEGTRVFAGAVQSYMDEKISNGMATAYKGCCCTIWVVLSIDPYRSEIL